MNDFKDNTIWTQFGPEPNWTQGPVNKDDLLAEIAYLRKALNGWKRRAHLLAVDKNYCACGCECLNT